MSDVLITGAAGFIGFHLSNMLAAGGTGVVGFDNVNDYYDVAIKNDRLSLLRQNHNFVFEMGDLSDMQVLDGLFSKYRPGIVIHLAAQAGVRYSMENPRAYIDSNMVGFFNILEACKKYPVKHLLFASSSSVYGNSNKPPYKVGGDVTAPVSLYAATKMSNELMAYTYSHLYGTPMTGLRFFTVYGPYGRPDMAYYSFTKKIFDGEPIKIYNNGDLQRDFTYVDDIVEAMCRMVGSPPKTGGQTNGSPFKVYNIGGGRPQRLLYFIETLENIIGNKALKEFVPMQPGDVYMTCADTSDLENDFGCVPKVGIEEGLGRFVEWYKKYHNCTCGPAR